MKTTATYPAPTVQQIVNRCTLDEWHGIIHQLIRERGPEARLILDAGPNNISAEVEVDVEVPDVPAKIKRPVLNAPNAALVRFKDAQWEKLSLDQQTRLSSGNGYSLRLAQWEAATEEEFIARKKRRTAQRESSTDVWRNLKRLNITIDKAHVVRRNGVRIGLPDETGKPSR